MEARSRPLAVTTEGSTDPLCYLDPYERALCGWAVTRMFATGQPSFVRAMNKYGPEGMAYYACGRTFLFFCFPLGISAAMAAFVSLGLSYGLFCLIGVCIVLATRRLPSMLRAGKNYRYSRAEAA